MRNILGEMLTLTLFGESHGQMIGAVLDGVCPGIFIDNDFIKKMLSKRRPQGKTETSRVEQDSYQIISGVFNGYTTGQPICILIPNENIKSSDYDKTSFLARPSHVDYVAHEKYEGFEDYHGGGHFSGRLTAPIVVAGSIILKALQNKGINIYTHILECGGVQDVDFLESLNNIDSLDNKLYPVINDIEAEIINKINEVATNQDSIGGVIQTAITGLPIGLGEPWFSSMEGKLANAMFSIGGIKGIEFGSGFNFKNLTGQTANDAFRNIDGKIITTTNHNGGINGGITNGMPVIFNCAVKPTPSIFKSQDTINILTKENEKIEIKGRHDPAIIRRICVVATCLSALVIGDMLTIKNGNNSLK